MTTSTCRGLRLSMRQATGCPSSVAILPTFCPTGPHPAVRTRLNPDDEVRLHHAEQHGSGSDGRSRTDLDRSHPAENRKVGGAIPSLPTRRTGAPKASAAARDRSTRGAVVLVRAGSAQHREAAVLGGHERSRGAGRNRRSPHPHVEDLDRWSTAEEGSNPSARFCPAPRDVAHIAGPPSGLPEIAVRALVSKRVKDQERQIVPGQAPHLCHKALQPVHPLLRTTWVHQP